MAVSAAGAVVVLAGIEALRVRQPVAAVTPPLPEELAPEPLPAAPRLAPPPVVPTVSAQVAPGPPRDPFALARISGRIVGDRDALAAAEISVADSERSYHPWLADDGSFVINLPPGNYAVRVDAGELLALAEVLGLAAEENRDLVLPVVPSVAIAGRVQGCEGPCARVSVRAVTSGARVEAESTESDRQGGFVLEGMAPGTAYDLTFATAGRRDLTLRGIVAPTENLAAWLEPTAVLSGGFGVAPGQDCPMLSVAVVGGQAEEETEAAFDDDCRFHINELPTVERIRVRATGAGWHFNVEVPLPEHGDPPFLCLHPPCRESRT